jgi:Tfp pilus assembly protein PilF
MVGDTLVFGLADLNEALRVEPASADACLDRGRVYQHKGSYLAALADYQKALDLGPNEARFYNQYAWVLAACPRPEYRDGARAVELARRACDLTNWQDANFWTRWRRLMPSAANLTKR